MPASIFIDMAGDQAAEAGCRTTDRTRRKIFRKQRRVFAKHRPSDERLRRVVDRRIDKDGGWRRHRPEKEKMTPLLCNEPTLKMRRLFYCEKCLLFVCYCTQKRSKRRQRRKRCWKQKIFRRRRTVVAVVCYCLLLRPKKAVFDRLRQSKKRGDRVGRLTPWKTKKTRKSVCYCVCYNI